MKSETSLLRLIFTALYLLAMAACGGGSSGGPSAMTARGSIYVEHHRQDENCDRYATRCGVEIWGGVFNEFYGGSGGSRRCDTPYPGDIGVDVTWKNRSTGESGAAWVKWRVERSDWNGAMYCSSVWRARFDVPVNQVNEILIEAVGRSGRHGNTKLTLYPIRSLACARDEAVADGYRVGGTVTGLNGEGLALLNNGCDKLEVGGNSFEFEVALADGENYDVTVLRHAENQTCEVVGGQGEIENADASGVEVVCHGWSAPMPLFDHDPGADGADAIPELPAGIHQQGGDARYTVPWLAVNGHGDAVAAWLGIGDARSQLWTSRYTAGAGWGPAAIIDDAAAPLRYGGVQPTLDDSGHALILFGKFVGYARDLASVRADDSGGWQPAEAIGQPGVSFDFQVASDDSGERLIVWQECYTDYRDCALWYQQYASEPGWSQAVQLTAKIFGRNDMLNLAMNATGQAILVFGSHAMMAMRFDPDSGWRDAEKLIDCISCSDFFPRAAIDTAGNAIVVWRDESPVLVMGGYEYRDVIRSAYRIEGSGWGPPMKLDVADAGEWFFTPRLSMAHDGTAVASWRGSRVYYSRFE